jgi:hypothetical protein
MACLLQSCQVLRRLRPWCRRPRIAADPAGCFQRPFLALWIERPSCLSIQAKLRYCARGPGASARGTTRTASNRRRVQDALMDCGSRPAAAAPATRSAHARSPVCTGHRVADAARVAEIPHRSSGWPCSGVCVAPAPVFRANEDMHDRSVMCFSRRLAQEKEPAGNGADGLAEGTQGWPRTCSSPRARRCGPTRCIPAGDPWSRRRCGTASCSGCSPVAAGSGLSGCCGR